MRLVPLGLDGAFIVELEPISDERGWFARSFDAAAFEAAGLDASVVQANVSFNARRGTFRGLHHQAEPHREAKLIRCTRGAAYDVAVDVRPSSPTYRRTAGVELRAGGNEQVYLPGGIAHGFLTLEDETELTYLMSSEHVATSARGVRWDDPGIDLRLPGPIEVISDRDRTFPDVDW